MQYRQPQLQRYAGVHVVQAEPQYASLKFGAVEAVQRKFIPSYLEQNCCITKIVVTSNESCAMHMAMASVQSYK